MNKINKPSDLLALDCEAIEDYLRRRLKGENFSPGLDWRSDERPIDIFIQALHSRGEEKTETKDTKKYYRQCLAKAISSAMEKEFLEKWSCSTDKGLQKLPLRKIKKHKPDSWRYVTQLVHLAEELREESPCRTIFNIARTFLFPPQTEHPWPMEIGLLRLITFIRDPEIEKWWDAWIEGMKLAVREDKGVSFSARACRSRFPMVIFGLIMNNPSSAITYFIRALEGILIGEVKTDAISFIQDVTQGLVVCFPEEYAFYLSELIDEVNLSNKIRIRQQVKMALKDISFKDGEVNQKIRELIPTIINKPPGRPVPERRPVKLTPTIIINEQKSGLVNGHIYLESDRPPPKKETVSEQELEPDRPPQKKETDSEQEYVVGPRKIRSYKINDERMIIEVAKIKGEESAEDSNILDESIIVKLCGPLTSRESRLLLSQLGG